MTSGDGLMITAGWPGCGRTTGSCDRASLIKCDFIECTHRKFNNVYCEADGVLPGTLQSVLTLMIRYESGCRIFQFPCKPRSISHAAVEQVQIHLNLTDLSLQESRCNLFAVNFKRALLTCTWLIQWLISVRAFTMHTVFIQTRSSYRHHNPGRRGPR